MELLDVLLVPLRDLDGTIHMLQRIYEDGTKRFLSGGAKAGHFTLIGAALENAHGILLCEGWATGATAHEATGLPVIAAMDAGNLLRVAPLIRDRFPDATLVILADNDQKPGRDTNPGVNAAMTAARATNALIAIPSIPGDFNDLAAVSGIDAVRHEIWAAAPPPKLSPTYPLPTLDLMTVRGRLDDQMAEFMADVAAYWGDDQLDADLVPEAPWAAASTSEAAMPQGTACC
jgi:putative DNA primase/helicase